MNLRLQHQDCDFIEELDKHYIPGSDNVDEQPIRSNYILTKLNHTGSIGNITKGLK